MLAFAVSFAFSALQAEDRIAACLPSFVKDLEKSQQVESTKDQNDLLTTAVAAFESKVSPVTLDQLAMYAREHASDADGSAWTLLPIFVVRNRLDVVVEVAVLQLSGNDGDRQYRMWKWWETLFSARSDFASLSLDLGRAFVKCYEKGDAKTQAVITDIFGKKAQSLEALKQLVEGEALNKK